MASTPRGPALDGGQEDQERPLTDEPQSPFPNIASSVRRHLTRAFERNENVEVPYITDVRQLVV